MDSRKSDERRLTDKELAEVRRLRGVPGSIPSVARVVALDVDHDRARADRERLAEELRKQSDYEQEHTGSMCWCTDGREAPCYVGTMSDMCLRLNMLLREVAPRPQDQ